MTKLYTHVTSKCFVRRKLFDQSKTQHEIMVIPLSMGATQRWFSNLLTLHLEVSWVYIEIPALQKHKVSWTDPDNETIWLAVHY